MTPAAPSPQENAGVPPGAPGGHGSPAGLDYEVIRLVGSGGYGEVWLVRDQAGEYRACKVVYRESFHHDRPYEREYEGICKFEPVSQASESQVKILHVGRRDAAGYFYYIMELADDATTGQTIQPDQYVPRTLRSDLERRGRLPAGECLELGVALSAALENLHGHSLIHRDIKPANIIFVKGVPKLADIGLVTEADVTVSYVGTGGFIPPEGPGSAAADVYGLGKVLYEISTGKDRMEYPELPANFGELPDRVPLLELNAVVARACEADVRKRYASADELRRDLELLKSGRSVRRIRSAKRSLALITWAAAGLCVVLLLSMAVVSYLKHPPSGAGKILWPEHPAVKIPMPDAAHLAQAESSIKNACRSQLEGGTTAARQQASVELLNQAATAADPAVQLASFRVAALLATEAADFSLAMEICDRMADRFQMQPVPAKFDLLAQASPYARTPEKKAELAQLCLRTGFETLAADDYGHGGILVDMARNSAQRTADSRLVQESDFLASEMTRCAAAYQFVERSAQRLASKPGDPEANLAVGKFRCFVKNDWEGGLPLLARGNSDSLKQAITAETSRPDTPGRQVELGNLWWNLAAAAADEQTYFQQRARYWYLKAIAGSKGPGQSRIRQQLAERLNAVPTQPGEVHIRSRVAGTEFIDIYADQVLWKSGRGSVANRINQVTPDDFKPGDLQVIKNSGATRLLPESVDFSTARLTIDRKPKRQGQATLTMAEDHVRLTLAHPRVGAAELEVTVSFGGGQ